MKISKQNKQVGQALVEYVLLLVVVVALAGAIAVQLFEPLGNWTKNYLGNYFYCLLDAGELPSLGGPGTQGQCNDKFEEFSLANGRRAREGSESASQAGGEDIGRDREGRRRNRAGNVVSAPGGGRSSSIDLNAGRRGADGGGGNAGVTSVPRESSSASGYMSFGQTTVVYVRRDGERARGFAGVILDERDRARKREERSIVQNRSLEGEGGSRQRVPTQVPAVIARKKSEGELSGYDFSFGEILRFAMIIAIVAVLIFLIASQINSITKSLEK